MSSLSDNLLPDHLHGAVHEASGNETQQELESPEESRSFADLIVGAGALGISTFIHAAILVAKSRRPLAPGFARSEIGNIS